MHANSPFQVDSNPQESYEERMYNELIIFQAVGLLEQFSQVLDRLQLSSEFEEPNTLLKLNPFSAKSYQKLLKLVKVPFPAYHNTPDLYAHQDEQCKASIG